MYLQFGLLVLSPESIKKESSPVLNELKCFTYVHSCISMADMWDGIHRHSPMLSQMMEASLYDKIMDQQRLEPEFFRVGFYGKKFPFFLRVSYTLLDLL